MPAGDGGKKIMMILLKQRRLTSDLRSVLKITRKLMFTILLVK